jgi:hypothetical protein
MNKQSTSVLSRRRVFAGTGSAAALAAAAAALPLVKPSAGASAAKVATPADADGRYQASEHVLRYYQTTRV